jgi:branched-subunit amino acid aminotransferase/4-amino-4-deoxychorismate lyase
MPKLQIIRAGSFHPWLGVFETIRVCRGRPIFLEEHWQALRRSCAALGLKRPPDFRRCAAELPAHDGRWRWVIASADASHSFQREKKAARGELSLQLCAVRVGSQNWDARHKTLSYLAHWQARRANSRGEALLLNERGEIASGAMTNIFWVRRGRLFTPDEACGCRAGVVRGWIRSQVDARLTRSRHAVLDAADEIFVTNSMLGICPVRRWNGRTLSIGPVTCGLRRTYARVVRDA